MDNYLALDETDRTLGEIPDATRTGIGEIVMMKDLD